MGLDGLLALQILGKPSRRRLIAAGTAFAAGACASGKPPPAPADALFQNRETLSESVHCGVASADGRQRITVRICRYPELGLAWLWAHAATPAGFYSYVDHLAPATRDPTPEGDQTVAYADAAGRMRFVRTGPASRPVSARIEGEVPARRSAHAGLGAGDWPLRFEIAFTAHRAYSGLNPGRTEVFGEAEAVVITDAGRFVFSGPAQFHEQRQARPRFTTPFAYTTLWGETSASTLLITPARNDGYFLEDDRSTEARIIMLDPPSNRERRLVVALADGRRLEGRTQLVEAYTLPIYGETWRGHFLNVRLGGEMMRGNINDWLSSQMRYPLI